MLGRSSTLVGMTKFNVALIPGDGIGTEVVAEGVESLAMAQQLLAIDCDYGQGFGYAPALAAQEAEVYLNESLADGTAPLKARM